MGGLSGLLSSDKFWIVFGFAGQAVFGGAFVIQWLASEKRKRSHIPVSFWYLRIVGSLMLLALALKMWEQDNKSMVLVAGFSMNCVFYFRNLVLIHRRQAQLASGEVKGDQWDES
jgi:lipid-A-disaccharide synthase-like uncharacterized protein